MSGSWSRLLNGMRRPGAAIDHTFARLRGEFYRILLPLMGKRFKAGKGLEVRGRLVIRGPGSVVFGNNVQVWRKVTPFTHRKESVIEVGDNSVLDTVRFGSTLSIKIGSRCRIAESRIFDSDYHSVHMNRWDKDAPVRTAPIEIHDNVWIGTLAALLPGTTIGANSVVSFGSICSKEYPPNAIIAGNPARVVAPVPRARTSSTEGDSK